MSREAIEREIRNLEEKIEEMKELEEIKDGEIVEEEPDLAPAIEKWLEACQQVISFGFFRKEEKSCIYISIVRQFKFFKSMLKIA